LKQKTIELERIKLAYEIALYDIFIFGDKLSSEKAYNVLLKIGGESTFDYLEKFLK